MGRAHLVQATFQLPHRRGGGTARQFFLLRELARRFEVTVIAPADPGVPPEAYDELGAFATVAGFPVPPPRRNPVLRAAHLARMVGSPRPLASTGMDALRPAIRAALAGLRRPADIFYVEPSTTADWIDLAPPGTLRVLGFHDLTFAAYRERARRATRPGARLLDEVEWRRLRRLELGRAARVDLNVMISALERDALERLVPGAATVLAPNGVDVDYFRPAGPPDPSGPLVLLGSLNHPPNVDAAVRMVRDVLPAVGRPVALQIVGRSPVPEVVRLGGAPGVAVVGEVADVRPYLAGASIVCAPIMFGGGVRMKLLDALAMGCAVVCTPKAAEGFALRDGEELVIAPIDGYARAVAALLDDPERAAALGRRGREFVAREHSWATSADALADALDALGG
ncbi:MAG TPA: glycosyltransferase family 4 protein [Solirubrobacteraceae bacterium]|nr:glycosyltransferase family 4 protein [Solirubrobacteraceae bacterium]